MTYDKYPAIDDDLNFAPEVRAALAKTPELRNTVIPMTTAQRDAISADQLWDGRLILNTSTSRIERYESDNGSWTDSVEHDDLLDFLSDTMPLPTSSIGDVGIAEEAARADHVHAGSSGMTVEIFTTSSTYNKPANAKKIDVILYGGGGGGGSGIGMAYSSSYIAYGGGGGGGGGCFIASFRAVDISSSVPVTVGAGGVGGAKVACGGDAATAKGNPGQNGGASLFGSYAIVYGGAGAGTNNSNTYNAGGGGGVGSAGLGWYGGSPLPPGTPVYSQAGIAFEGGCGSTQNGLGGGPAVYGGAGGGAASSYSNVLNPLRYTGSGAGSAFGGAAGGGGTSVLYSYPNWNTARPGAGGAPHFFYPKNTSADGSDEPGCSPPGLPSTSDPSVRNGSDGVSPRAGGGGGAGQSYYNVAESAGNGGNGAAPAGGGGGGGGAEANSSAYFSGAGGNGGSGMAIVVTYT